MSTISTKKTFALSNFGYITPNMCGAIIHGEATNITNVSVGVLANNDPAGYDGFFVTIITNAGTIGLVGDIVTTIPANCISYLYYRYGVGFVVKSASILATGNEVDPVFTASPAYTITAQNKTDWSSGATHASSAHAPVNAQKNSDITKAEIEAKLTGEIDSHTHSGTLVTELDPVFLASPAGSITDQNKTEWNAGALHSQQEHAPPDAQRNSDITKAEIEAKLTGEINSHSHAGGVLEETDPVFANSPAYGIDANDIIRWDGADSHASSAHAPTNAQKNSDITKAEIEAKLTGEINSHTHSGITPPPMYARNLLTRFEPVTNGDILNPQLVFYNGDVVMVEVDN